MKVKRETKLAVSIVDRITVGTVKVNNAIRNVREEWKREWTRVNGWYGFGF